MFSKEENVISQINKNLKSSTVLKFLTKELLMVNQREKMNNTKP